MIKLYEEQKISLYQVQKDLNYGAYTLYRYAKGKRDIKNMPTKMLVELSNYFGMGIDILYKKMCEYGQIKGVK